MLKKVFLNNVRKDLKAIGLSGNTLYNAMIVVRNNYDNTIDLNLTKDEMIKIVKTKFLQQDEVVTIKKELNPNWVKSAKALGVDISNYVWIYTPKDRVFGKALHLREFLRKNKKNEHK